LQNASGRLSSNDDHRDEPAVITAIIVNYNSGALLTACVASLINSSCEVNVVVSDNGSGDDSLARLQAFYGEEPRLTIVRNHANLGFSAGCNRGLHYASGEYVLFINPDCVVGTETLLRMRTMMEAHPEVGMAGCLIRNVDGSEQIGCRRYVPTPWRSFVRVLRLDRLFPRDPRFQTFNLAGTLLPPEPVVIEAISGAFMLVRQTALEKVGQLDEHYFLHCEDLDWCMRFRQEGYSILFVPGVEITHLKGGSRAPPLFVEWHKHKGMTRFYLRFFRHQYPSALMFLVIAAVWARLALMTPYLLLKGSPGYRPDMRSAYLQWAESSRMTAATQASRTIIVSGASSQIGVFLLPLLAEAGYRVIALSRRAAPNADADASENIIWLQTDMQDTYSLGSLPPAHCLIHLAPLNILPPQLAAFSTIGVKRIIAFSSSSRHSKAESPIAAERVFARQLDAAEQSLARLSESHGIRWTVFRPTLIYGREMDRNITLIRRLIRTVGVFPLLGAASGLRQPVHAADLAAACVAALNNPHTFDKAYDLSGGETLTYRDMVGRIFESLNHRPRFVTVPMALFSAAIGALSVIPRYRDFNIAMAQRMNEDLVYEHGDATRDFGYLPNKFTP
jgi:hypothetical protein